MVYNAKCSADPRAHKGKKRGSSRREGPYFGISATNMTSNCLGDSCGWNEPGSSSGGFSVRFSSVRPVSFSWTEGMGLLTRSLRWFARPAFFANCQSFAERDGKYFYALGWVRCAASWLRERLQAITKTKTAPAKFVLAKRTKPSFPETSVRATTNAPKNAHKAAAATNMGRTRVSLLNVLRSIH